MSLLLLAAAIAATPPERPLTAPGPEGALSATLVDAGPGSPVAIIIPGSGPTDRDGNNPMGVKARPYQLLADALAATGLSTVRIDKRGMFGSKAALADANKVTIAGYATDAHAWAKAARSATGAKCVWLIGHSEGALVALKAGQDPTDLCGVIAVSAMGRKFGTVLRDQLKANPANSVFLDAALGVIAELEQGRTVPADKLGPILPMVFPPAVQPYLIDVMAQDSVALASTLKLPLLVVQGDKDIQIGIADAQSLASAHKDATLAIVPDVNHVLKKIASTDPATQLKTYADPDLPIAQEVVDAIAGFVKR